MNLDHSIERLYALKVDTTTRDGGTDHNLNIPLYVEMIIEDDLHSVEEALAYLKTAWTECPQAEDHLKSKLREFGVSV